MLLTQNTKYAGFSNEKHGKDIEKHYSYSVQGIAERYATNQDVALPEAEWLVDIIRRK